MLFELRQRRDPVLQLPFPIVPKFARNARPVSGRVRNELFSVPISKRLHLSEDENAKTTRFCVNARTGKCAAHFNQGGFCLTELRRRCRSGSRQKASSLFRRASECNRVRPDNSAPRLHAFQNRDSSSA